MENLFFGETVESIDEFDPFMGTVSKSLEEITVFANSHYVTPKPSLVRAIDQIKIELEERIRFLNQKNYFLKHKESSKGQNSILK